MCLDRLETFKPCTVGYKIIYRDYCNKRFYRFLIKGYGSFLPKIWLNESSYRYPGDGETLPLELGNDSNFTYPIGFHICHTIAGAIVHFRKFGFTDSILVKVKIRQAVATGYQFGHKVTVAKEMYIIKEIHTFKTFSIEELNSIVKVEKWKGIIPKLRNKD